MIYLNNSGQEFSQRCDNYFVNYGMHYQTLCDLTRQITIDIYELTHYQESHTITTAKLESKTLECGAKPCMHAVFHSNFAAYIAGFQFLDLYLTNQILSGSIMTSFFVWNQILLLCPFHKVLVSCTNHEGVLWFLQEINRN